MLRQPIYQTRGYENHNDAGAFIAGAIVALLLIAIVLSILLLLKKNKENAVHTADVSQIIRERYARGEINKEEYENLANDLLSAPIASSKSTKKNL